MQSRTNVFWWLAGIMAAALLAISIALISQYGFNMKPCPWCVLQRLLFLAIAIVSATGLAGRNRYWIPVGGVVLTLTLLGMAAAGWQHFVAAASNSCNRTLADKIVSSYLHLDQLLPSVFAARATCADAAVRLFGIPYDFWSLGLFAAIAVASVHYMRQSIRA